MNNSIGLKTLLEDERLIIIVKPNVHHLSWHTNKRVINEVIMPYLDWTDLSKASRRLWLEWLNIQFWTDTNKSAQYTVQVYMT